MMHPNQANMMQAIGLQAIAMHANTMPSNLSGVYMPQVDGYVPPTIRLACTLEDHSYFEYWNAVLLDTLDCYGLRRYIVPGWSEPANDPHLWIKWSRDRAAIGLVIKTHISAQVIAKLRGEGWKLTEEDPKATYDLI
ncbi:hypothetical protein B0H66DRAFT_591531 [Apodospora peruviana]|uniref:Uncharacterized protein n=1 Tax=Apodospora peruviana TaxID=516989 RepID=A0AAE0I5A9_9PEZI|nr:hypothetical protein B0H66DRAFT_591531 [Apodospora peruviana]